VHLPSPLTEVLAPTADRSVPSSEVELDVLHSAGRPILGRLSRPLRRELTSPKRPRANDLYPIHVQHGKNANSLLMAMRCAAYSMIS
jgi:hypothetical protein